MSQYIVVRGLSDVALSSQGTVANWLVVDTTALVVIADCGDNQTRANAIASALNGA